MDRKNPFHPDPVGYPAHGKGFSQAPALPPQNHTFKNLDPFTASFNHPYMDPYRIPGSKGGYIFFKILFFNLFY
jgi:hypothetical protein